MEKLVLWGYLNKTFPLLALAWCLQGCYVLKQGYHLHYQLNYQRHPVDSYINDRNTSPLHKEKLTFIKEVMNYAKRQGLDNDGSYEHVVDNNKKYISHLVYAAHPLKYQSKTWWAPIVGTVPYLGFFEEAEREELAKKLESEGLDVYRGVAGGFSSLGWWDDPIYKQMLRRDKIDLALLFFHELVHTSFWLKGSVELNENLAEFIGTMLTEKFFLAKSQKNLVIEMKNRFSDQKIYVSWLRKRKEIIKNILSDIQLSDKDKQIKKDSFYKKMNTNLPVFHSSRYRYLKRKKWNNASMIAASLYSPDIDQFSKIYACSKAKKAGEFLSVLESEASKYDNTKTLLKSFCS